MPLPETKVAILSEIQAWENIIHSEDWIVFRRLLKDHSDWLQKEANDYIRSQKHTEAFGSLRAMDDCQKILNLVTKRISDLKNKKEE
jgi:hypothetical protein